MAASYQTLADVYSDVRYIVGKDSNTLVDSDLLRISNKYYFRLVREIIGLNEDLYAEISKADLKDGQREYLLPTDDTSSPYGGGLIKIQRVELNYSDASSSTWVVASPTSLQEIQGPTILNADLSSQYSRTTPKYWFKDRSVWVAPVPEADVTDGIYIYWIKRPDEMTATSDIPDMPRDFLGVLTEGILIDVFRKYGRLSESNTSRDNWAVGIAKMRELEQNIDQEQIYTLKTIRKNYE